MVQRGGLFDEFNKTQYQRGVVSLEMGIVIGILVVVMMVIFDFFLIFQSTAVLERAAALAAEHDVFSAVQSRHQHIGQVVLAEARAMLPVEGLSCSSRSPSGPIGGAGCCAEGSARCLSIVIEETSAEGGRLVILRYTNSLMVLASWRGLTSSGPERVLSSGEVSAGLTAWPRVGAPLYARPGVENSFPGTQFAPSRSWG